MNQFRSDDAKRWRCRAWTRISWHRKRCRNARKPGKDQCGMHLHQRDFEKISPEEDVGQVERDLFISRSFILFRVRDLFERSGIEDGELILAEMERRMPQDEPKENQEPVWETRRVRNGLGY